MIKRKIKILDIDEIRNSINDIYDRQNQIILAKWSLEIANHIISNVNIDIKKYPEIEEGFLINKSWQEGKARKHDVRQVGFKIHKIAKKQSSDLFKNTLRVIGHAAASGHMKEHAIVASDYAIKVISILYNNDIVKIQEERLWHLKALINLSTKEQKEQFEI